MQFAKIIVLFVLALSFHVAVAQGAADGAADGTADGATSDAEPTDPVVTSPPSLGTASPGTPVDPVGSPATPGSTAAPTSSPTPRPTPQATSAPESALTGISREEAELLYVLDPPPGTENNSSNFLLAGIIAGAAIIPLGFLAGWMMNKNKSKVKEKEKSDCRNIKKLLDEKLEELKDLKAQAVEKGQEVAREKLMQSVGGTTLARLDKAEQEYNKLKDMYQKCVIEFGDGIGKTAFIFHGTEGYPEENWFPWLKEKLESKGYEVFVPKFPTPENQSLESWLQVFEEYKKYLHEDTIFIGHSIAPAFILGILERIDTSIAKCIFVAPFLEPLGEETYDQINSTFVNQNFDWEKIKDRCKEFNVYYSDNDPYVPQKASELVAEKVGAKTYLVKGAGHFNKAAGYTQFEELWARLQ